MKLTNPEKLILLMLAEIYDKLDLREVHTNLISSAIRSENTWALDWEMPGIVGSESEPTPPLVTKVVSVLDMWSFVEEAMATFDPATRLQVEKEAEPFGRHVRFPGFDGNNEGQALAIARILIDDMGRFSRFRGRDLNSHAPMLATYERMFKLYEPLRTGLTGFKALSSKEVIALLQAMRHA